MPEAPGSPPSPRTPLFWDGARWHYARVDDDGRVQVRGEDQLFSFKEVLGLYVGPVISGADGYVQSASVPAGEIWVVTHAACRDITTAPTRQVIMNFHDGAELDLLEEIKAFALKERSIWSGMTFLDVDDVIRAYFTGGLVGDICAIAIGGYKMTVET